MRQAGLDALVSISPENFAYVTGFLSPTQPLMRWRHAMALVTADGAQALIVVDMEASTIRPRRLRATEIAVWHEFNVRRHERARRCSCARMACQRAYRHRDGLSAGRRFRRASQSSCPMRDLRPAQALARASAPDQDAGRDRYSAQALAHRRSAITEAYRSVRAGDQAKWTWPPRSRAASTSRAPSISS